jgi:hypothetical protein
MNSLPFEPSSYGDRKSKIAAAFQRIAKHFASGSMELSEPDHDSIAKKIGCQAKLYDFYA